MKNEAMPLQRTMLATAVMAVSICFASPSHGDDLSNLKTVLKSASPQEKIEAIEGSWPHLTKSRTHEGVKLLFDVGVNEDEDLGVRLAALRILVYFDFAWSMNGQSRLGVLKSEFEATYKDARSDSVSRAIVISMFLLSNTALVSEVESPFWISADDPNKQLLLALQFLKERQYKEAFPILLKRLDDDRVSSFIAAKLLSTVSTSLTQPRGKSGNGTELPQWFDLPAPVLTRQLGLWRKSEDHVELTKAFESARYDVEVFDPVRTLVGLIGLVYVHDKSEPRDGPILTALIELLDDNTVTEKARRDAGYWIAEGNSERNLLNMFAESPESATAKMVLRRIHVDPSLVNEIKKKPGPMVVRLIEIAENDKLTIQTRSKAIGLLPRTGSEASEALPALKKLSVREPNLVREDYLTKEWKERQAYRRRQAFAEHARRIHERIREMQSETATAGE